MPVPEKLNTILRRAFELKASDVHLHSGARLSIRVNGELLERGEQPVPATAAEPLLLALLSAEDLEDVVALWLQVTVKCAVFTSTCKNDTKDVEGILVTLDEGNRIGFQVKSGESPIDRNKYATFDGKVYLFAASECYLGDHNDSCVYIQPDTIRQFVMANKKIMPGRVQQWINYVETVLRDS